MSNPRLVLRQGDPFGPGPISINRSPPSLGPGPVDPPPATPTNSGSSSMGTSLTFPLGPSSTDSSSPSASLSISSTPPIPTGSLPPVPFWSINNITSATTCEPLALHWFVADTNDVDLSHTNVRLFITGGLDHDNNVNLTISTGRPIRDETYTWPAVTVPAGNYAIQGIADEGSHVIVDTAIFPVRAGSNTSCLSSSSPGSSSGNQAGQHGSPPISTLKKHTNTAAIVGGTLGGLAFLIAVAAALFIFTLRQKSTPKRHRKRGFRRGWGGLDSVDFKSRNAPNNKIISSGASNDSFGAALRHTQSMNSEKDRDVILDTIVVPESEYNESLHSQQHYSAALSSSVAVQPSPSPASMELSRLSGRLHAAQDSPRSSVDFSDPFASGLTPTPSSRRASRTARKPVPTYEPTQEELDALAMARSSRSNDQSRSQSQSQSRPGSSQRLSPSSINNNSNNNNRSPFANARQLDAVSISSMSDHGAQLLHGLKSKSSGHFDNQPVHYLIPDMPPPPPAN